MRPANGSFMRRAAACAALATFALAVPARAEEAVITEYHIPIDRYSIPFDITTGPDGNLWFTDSAYATFRGINTPAPGIGRVTPDGSITQYVLPTDGGDPYGIAAGPDGNVWFTENSSGEIGRITPAGIVKEFSIPTYDSRPADIVAGSDGNLWFAEERGKIGRITPAGVFTEFPLPSPALPHGITAGPDGNLWFTDLGGNKIGRITPWGVVSEFAVPTADSRLAFIAAGPDGNLWFTESAANKIGRITPTGIVTEFPVPTPNSWPQSIAAGPDGNLWFTETYAGKVARITTGGLISEYLPPTPQSSPAGITAGPDGNVWFVEGCKNVARLIPPPSPPRPTPPSAPESLTASTRQPKGVALTWTPPAATGSSPVTGYRVYRGTTSGGEEFLASAGNVTTYSDTATKKGVTYYYKVTAVSSVGESPASNEASAQSG